MRPDSLLSLWEVLKAGGDAPMTILMGSLWKVSLQEMVCGTVLAGHREQLRDKSVLIAATDQAVAGLALLELDGIARRVVLYPPDLPLDHLPYVIEHAQVDAIVCDRAFGNAASPDRDFIPCDNPVQPDSCDRSRTLETEWVLLTSGTTGRPKMVMHTLTSLTGAVGPGTAQNAGIVWSTFYDIRRYGGMQIFLRAVVTGTSLVLGGAQESTADFLTRAGANGVTHISGTPSHWRRALMSPAANRIDPEYIRLSGEIADQGILNSLRAFYPKARIGHAFATTEAGVAFDVKDCQAGFPAESIAATPGVEMKVVEGTLRIRSSRTAIRYLGEGVPVLKDVEGWVDTGDVLDLREGRYYFSGRRDGTINVGGLKVHPEEVEAVINRHPQVQVSRVRTKKNPITGALVVADVVLRPLAGETGDSPRELQQNILLLCRETLASHKVPTAINFVASLEISETGKLIRRHA
jgi:acyl-coenzyme A synthetase/AMP-(fatty) acid ligase